MPGFMTFTMNLLIRVGAVLPEIRAVVMKDVHVLALVMGQLHLCIKLLLGTSPYCIQSVNDCSILRLLLHGRSKD